MAYRGQSGRSLKSAFGCSCLFLLLFACEGGQDAAVKQERYVNENGSVILAPQDDSLFEVSFKNDRGDELDTMMRMVADPPWDILSDPGEAFLAFRSSEGKIEEPSQARGIILDQGRLSLMEFTGMARLSRSIPIEGIARRSFFKTGEPIEISGEHYFSKAGSVLNGIYLKGFEAEEGSLKVKGRIEKEPYPEAFYVTEESPQGTISKDTGKKEHYRLIMKDPELLEPPE